MSSKLHPINNVEKKLAKCVERGKAFYFTTDDIKEGKSLRAEFLRSLALGLAKNASGQSIRVTPYGIHIRSAEDNISDKEIGTRKPHTPKNAIEWAEVPRLPISNRLSLAFLNGTEAGDSLFPISIEWCRFNGTLNLNSARLSSLSLKGSQFTALSLTDASLTGKLDLTYCGPSPSSSINGTDTNIDFNVQMSCFPFSGRFPAAELQTKQDQIPNNSQFNTFFAANDHAFSLLPERCAIFECVIDATSMTVGGAADLQHSYFCRNIEPTHFFGRSPKRQKWTIDFSNARIRDNLDISESIFIGGCNLDAAYVDGDFWLNGSRIFKRKDDHNNYTAALKMQGTTVRGMMVSSESNNNDFDTTFIVGNIFAHGLTVRELWLSSLIIHGEIDIDKAVIKNSATFGNYTEDGSDGEIFIDGKIILEDTRIEKNLEFNCVQPATFPKIENHEECGNNSFKIDVDNLLNIQTTRSKNLIHTRSIRSLIPCLYRSKTETSSVSVNARGAKIGGHLRIFNSKFEAEKFISNNDSDVSTGDPDTINQESISNNSITSKCAIDIWKSSVDNGLIIRSGCIFRGQVRLDQSYIGKDVSVSDAYIMAGPMVDDIPAALSLKGCKVDGNVEIGGTTPTPSRKDTPSIPVTKHGVEFLGALDFDRCAILGNLAIDHIHINLGKRVISYEDKQPTCKAISAVNCSVQGDIFIENINWSFEPDKRPRKHAHKNRWSKPDPIESAALIDLSGLTCTTLRDKSGGAWNLDSNRYLKLFLSGFKCAHVETTPEQRKTAIPYEERINWLGRQFSPPVKAHNGPLGQFGFQFIPSHVRPDFIPQVYNMFARANHNDGRRAEANSILKAKKDFENRILFTYLKKNTVTRVFYSSIADFLSNNRKSTKQDNIRGIIYLFPIMAIIIYLNTIGVFNFNEKNNVSLYIIKYIIVYIFPAIVILSLLSPYLFFITFTFFRILFSYALSPIRSIITLLCFILLGGAIVSGMQTGNFTNLSGIFVPSEYNKNNDFILMMNVINDLSDSSTSLNPTYNLEDSEGTGKTLIEIGKPRVANPIPCVLGINSYLFAADHFIPLLDLGQRDKCKVRERPMQLYQGDPYYWWRLFLAVYEALGWVVTSLVILTFSGIMKRELMHD